MVPWQILTIFDFLCYYMIFFTVNVGIIKLFNGSSVGSRQAVDCVVPSEQRARVFRLFRFLVKFLCFTGPIATSTSCSYLLGHLTVPHDFYSILCVSVKWSCWPCLYSMVWDFISLVSFYMLVMSTMTTVNNALTRILVRLLLLSQDW